MTERALELLNLPEESDMLLLDIGCGSGISGEVVSENGHYWVGFDISRSMLSISFAIKYSFNFLKKRYCC